jgi:hypothetical protein
MNTAFRRCWMDQFLRRYLSKELALLPVGIFLVISSLENALAQTLTISMLLTHLPTGKLSQGPLRTRSHFAKHTQISPRRVDFAALRTTYK